MNENTQILIVDDDIEIRELLGKFLKEYGFDTHLACDGVEMFKIMDKTNVDLIILDIMMPGDDGFELCKKLRSDTQVPILMLSAAGEETDRIVGLEMGADDFVPKPFNPRELLARIKAILRRQESTAPITEQPATFIFDDWQLHTGTRCLTSPKQEEVPLSSGEYTLLCAFVNKAQQVLNRDQLLEFTHNRNAGPFDRSIDVQVSRLRQKIESDPKNPKFIKTVRGGGYLFTPAVNKA